MIGYIVDILRAVVSVNVMLMILYFAKLQYFLLEKRVTLSIKCVTLIL